MRRYRKAKIIATLGPASSTFAMIENLFKAGVDVFRLNFSHGSYEIHQANIQFIRKVEEKYKRPIGILMDLQGPKLRVGVFKQQAVELKAGTSFTLDLKEEAGDERRVFFPHAEIYASLVPHTHLLLDDGKIRLKVLRQEATKLETEVVVGGMLSAHKGVNVPNALLPLSALTEKDKKDLEFGLSQDIDWVALSFVQKPSDIAELRSLVQGRAMIIAKIEKPAAMNDLEGIIALSDGIMVARGDLGVEMLPEEVPSLQRKIVRACRQAGKPVAVATQMLESMISNPTPTRAEASDVATAIYEGADAVMLSAESAAGKYPLEAVMMMERIIQRTEQDKETFYPDSGIYEPNPTESDSIAEAASQIARTVRAAAVVTFSSSGFTTFRAARKRPHVPILSITHTEKVSRQLTLVWGVHSVCVHPLREETDLVKWASCEAFKGKLASKGEFIVITAGIPLLVSGTTNMLRIARVMEEEQ